MLNYQKRELKVALDRLGDEVAYKNEFFAIVSHELPPRRYQHFGHTRAS